MKNLILLLETLEQPYTLNGTTLIIQPTSSPLLEILPGDWVSTEDSTELHLDITTFDFIKYVAKKITSLADTI